MSIPRVIVDVGFSGPSLGTEMVLGDTMRGIVGTATVGGDETWEDITAYVRSWSFRRGASRGDGPTLRYEAGTATIDLNNGDRRFDPTNLDGPYVLAGESEVVPMVRVRVRAVWDETTYHLFYGFADQWALNYQATSWSTVTLTATDAIKVFSSYDRAEGAPVGASEDSGARIDRILDSIDWPTEDRDIAVGDSTLQATTLAGNAQTELQLVQDSELGDFFVDSQGKAVFRNREMILTRDASAASQAVFGDGGYIVPLTYTFEAPLGVADFTPTDCTIETSSVIVHDGTQSMLMTSVGTPTQAFARQIQEAPVMEGRQYQVGFWVYTPVSWSMGAALDWHAGGVYHSTTSAAATIPAATWTYHSVTGTAPATVDGVSFGATIRTNPPDGTQAYIDQLTLVDLDNELPYADVTISTDDDQMANLITLAREGGTEQVVEDSGSRTKYLTKTFQRLDLLLETDAEVLQHANWLLYQTSVPELRFSQLTLNNPRPETEELLWPQMIGRGFGDRITIIRRPPGGGDPVQRDVFIRGVEMSSDGAVWRTGYTLESATKYGFFIVGDPVYGVIGENALGF